MVVRSGPPGEQSMPRGSLVKETVILVDMLAFGPYSNDIEIGLGDARLGCAI